MELLNNNHILANELVQKMGIHIANASMINSPNVLKLGNCNFIEKNDNHLPKNMRKFIRENSDTFTNLENLLPATYARDELGVSQKHLLSSEIVTDVVEIANKDFYKFNETFVKRVRKKILNVLDKDEFKECLSEKLITDYIELTKNKYLTMY